MKFRDKIRFLILIALFSLQNIASAQIANEIIIGKIEGNLYIIKNFASDNQLKNSQIFKAGVVFQKDDNYILPITIYSYDKNGILNDSTFYKCIPEKRKMLITVFPNAGKYSGSSMKVSEVSSSQLYPEKWKGLETLDNYSFNLNIEGGIAGFLGARSKIVLSDRSVKRLDKNKYSVAGTLSVKSYAWGINIYSLNYKTTETIDLLKGIVYQKYIESDGSYFTMELKQ